MNEDDVIIAAKTIYGEARGESFGGQVAVAWVIRNRADNPRWWGGPDWRSVCLSPWQFSCWNDGNPNLNRLRALTTDDLLARDGAAQSCLTAMLAVNANLCADLTGEATHYVVTDWLHDPDLRPGWADALRQTAVIGRHTFFTALEN